MLIKFILSLFTISLSAKVMASQYPCPAECKAVGTLSLSEQGLGNFAQMVVQEVETPKPGEQPEITGAIREAINEEFKTLEIGSDPDKAVVPMAININHFKLNDFKIGLNEAPVCKNGICKMKVELERFDVSADMSAQIGDSKLKNSLSRVSLNRKGPKIYAEIEMKVNPNTGRIEDMIRAVKLGSPVVPPGSLNMSFGGFVLDGTDTFDQILAKIYPGKVKEMRVKIAQDPSLKEGVYKAAAKKFGAPSATVLRQMEAAFNIAGPLTSGGLTDLIKKTMQLDPAKIEHVRGKINAALAKMPEYLDNVTRKIPQPGLQALSDRGRLRDQQEALLKKQSDGSITDSERQTLRALATQIAALSKTIEDDKIKMTLQAGIQKKENIEDQGVSMNLFEGPESCNGLQGTRYKPNPLAKTDKADFRTELTPAGLESYLGRMQASGKMNVCSEALAADGTCGGNLLEITQPPKIVGIRDGRYLISVNGVLNNDGLFGSKVTATIRALPVTCTDPRSNGQPCFRIENPNAQTQGLPWVFGAGTDIEDAIREGASTLATSGLGQIPRSNLVGSRINASGNLEMDWTVAPLVATTRKP